MTTNPSKYILLAIILHIKVSPNQGIDYSKKYN